MFKHLIITRFNLRKTDWVTSKSNHPVLTEEWLKNRFELFENYCLPAVKAQTNKNFTWLVYFDIETPDAYIQRINKIKETFKNFEPLFINGMDEFLPQIENSLANITEPYIITSRIDNDDCISIHYVDEIQKQFNKQEFIALDFIDGYALQLEPVTRIGFKRQQYNPFISLIEKNDPQKNKPQSVWCISHTDWKREPRVKTIKNNRIWLQIVHLENKVNEFVAYGDVKFENILKDFPINKNCSLTIKNKLIPVSKWKKDHFFSKYLSHFDYHFRNLKKAMGYYKKK
ncbi:glycosyltransferase [Abyssalbus ytuae]|uniref:Rhamnosyl transferase n=1 Tax=Abyssalbus ytuae TaxID=2926907 RepID=A0A9E7D0A9_9FLAO|nr:glycosyltransferase [Abyssalbus ytuae]UOB18265.1 putative rhamnosyl transferase [Abyssalbus ytuae]